VIGGAAVAAWLVAACGSAPVVVAPTYPAPGTIVLGSFDFPESDLLTQLYGQVLASNGFRVVYARDVGPREVVEPALWQGMVNFVPEYLGSALDYFQGSGAAVSSTVQTLDDLQVALAERGARALTPAPAQNQNVVVVTSDTAVREGLHRISDLSRVSDELTLGGPPQCPERDLCLPGLEGTYGLSFKEFLPLSGSDVVAASLKAQQIQVGVLFSTDGVLLPSGLTVLRDDRVLQPAENIVPVVRTELLKELGSRGTTLVELTNALSERLTTLWVQILNAQVAGGRTPDDVAGRWLERHASDLLSGA
jgi:osmoprotectant transport system substrate-binding protein